MIIANSFRIENFVLMKGICIFIILFITKRVVDFRSDWALLSLPLRFRAEQSFLGASVEPLGPTDVFCAKA
ncbi:hypothetical protein [Lysinibacillus xylanilyticus]|uniref:Uncharacterized protein n=1 Tax=Lysinibacillus xylanilyticus TaxID=582475 RepID=A0ABT4EIQ1_9BACI|nr:hypothetical protein [Lysinibacillus xylanilyticus]MCY9545532.1 hypothetical protein [Lysinibacillus xylanilyticus]